MTTFRGWIAALVLALAIAGCETQYETPAVEDDTPAGNGAFDGMTPEEIRRQAEPMSPEVAESLGIVDTSIHLEERLGEDSVRMPRDSVTPTDSVPY